jgi:hypothetical protein
MAPRRGAERFESISNPYPTYSPDQTNQTYPPDQTSRCAAE